MTKFKPIPSAELLWSRYDYDPQTGLLWSRRTGAPVGTPRGGYLIVRIFDSEFKVARVIWKMITGEDPPDEVDHEDLDPLNNRWLNLRDATHRQNMTNKRARSDSSTGLKGIIRRPARNGRAERFEVWIQVGDKRLYLGSSKSEDAAHELYKNAADQHFGAFAKY